MITVTEAEFSAKIAKEMQRFANSEIVIEIEWDCYYIFSDELTMYRIADKYDCTKGFSKPANKWYVRINHNVPILDL